MTIRLHTIAAILVGCIFTSMARAETIEMTAMLSGANEVPPIESPASGSAVITFDTATRKLTWQIEFKDLTAALRAAHFHAAPSPTLNGGVVVGIAMAGATSPLTGSTDLTPDQAAGLLAGHWYINIHTASHPPGEIRGQVVRR